MRRTGLQKQVLTVAFSGDVDESIDPKMLPNGKLRAVDNALYDKTGSIQKRLGWAAVSMSTLTASLVGSPDTTRVRRRLFRRADELCTYDGLQVLARQTAMSNVWTYKGETGSVKAERVQTPRDAGLRIQEMDTAVSGNVMCSIYLMTSSDGVTRYVYSTLTDLAGGIIAQHKPVEVSGDCTYPRIIVVNDGVNDIFCAFYIRGGVVYESRLSVAALSLSWTAGASLLACDSPPFDVVSMVTGSYCLACVSASGTRVNLAVYALGGGAAIATSSISMFAVVAPVGVALDYANNKILVANYDGGSSRVIVTIYTNILTAPLSIVVGSPVGAGGGCPSRIGIAASSTLIVAFWQDAVASGYGAGLYTQKLVWRAMDYAGNVKGSGSSFLVNHLLTARPRFSSDGAFVYALTSVDDWYQTIPAHSGKRYGQGLYMLRVNAALLAAGAATSSGGALSATLVSQFALGEGLGLVRYGEVRQMTRVTSTPERGSMDTFYVAQALATVYFDAFNIASVVWQNFRLTVDDIDALQPVGCGTTTMLSGGVPSIYDGSVSGELSWPYPPMIMRLDPTSGGSMTTGAVYTYQVVFEAWLNDGTVIYSETSEKAETTLAGGLTGCMMAFRGCSLTNKGVFFPSDYARLYAVVYRSLADNSDVLYRVARLPLNYNAQDYYVLTDLASDDDIRPNEEIYTVGNEYDSTALPSSSVMSRMDRRALARSDEFKRRVFFSKPLVRGRPLEFNYEFQYVDFPVDIYATAAQRGGGIAFGEDAVYLIEGDGPGTNGQGQSFSITQLGTGVGTKHPMSVAETPIGTFFRCGDILYLLNLGYKFEDKGSAFIDTVKAYPIVRRAEVFEADSTVRWVMLTEDGTAAIVVTYNWLLDRWSRHYPTLGDNTAHSNKPMEDILCMGAGQTFCSAGAYVFTETGYSDPAQVSGAAKAIFYPLVIELGAINFGDLDKFIRCWRAMFLMTRKGAHSFKVSMAINGALGYIWSRTFTDDDITGLGELEQLLVHLKYQDLSRVSFKLEDLEPPAGGGSEGYAAHGLTLEYGAKTGILKTSQKASK